jgi:hypothetical protein
MDSCGCGGFKPIKEKKNSLKMFKKFKVKRHRRKNKLIFKKY